VLHLALVPVAGVGDDHPGRLRAGARELTLGDIHQRLEVAEVGRLDHHLGGGDDLVLVDRRLGVVALGGLATERLHEPRVGSAVLIVAAGSRGGR
jgi:hypothetical protein